MTYYHKATLPGSFQRKLAAAASGKLPRKEWEVSSVPLKAMEGATALPRLPER